MKSGTYDNVTINHDNWKFVMCEAAVKKWSDFIVMKSDIVEHTCEHLHKLKTYGRPVRYVRLDPAGCWEQWSGCVTANRFRIYVMGHPSAQEYDQVGIPVSSREGSCNDGRDNGT